MMVAGDDHRTALHRLRSGRHRTPRTSPTTPQTGRRPITTTARRDGAPACSSLRWWAQELEPQRSRSGHAARVTMHRA